MNKVTIEIKESDLENKYTQSSYANIWAILLNNMTQEEQDNAQKDYKEYRTEMKSKSLVPLDAYVWGLLNFDIMVGYNKKSK